MPKITWKAARHARRLHQAHKTDDEIILAFSAKYSLDEIKAGMEMLRALGRRQYEPRQRKSDYQKDITVPPEVEKRKAQRTMLRPISITALLCGDPLPGESALERRKVKAPSIAHDYLDDLLYAG